MKKYISLSSHPGNTGKYFYTNFFDYYNIDAVYEPQGTSNLKVALEQYPDVDGISVSMPFKKEIIQYLDKTSELVDQWQLCNTVKIENGVLTGYNCDYHGMCHVVSHIENLACNTVSILGDGAIGTMFAEWLKEYRPTVYSRKLGTWHSRHSAADVLINCTSFGTIDNNSPVDYLPENIQLVIDLAIKNNNLAEQCIYNNIKYISGKEFYKFQFLSQFEIYTGITASPEIYDQFEIKLYEKI